MELLVSLAWLVGFLVLGATLAYRRSALATSTIAIGAALLVYTATRDPGRWWELACWLVFLLVAVPLNVPVLRRSMLTAPLLATYRRIMPEMSDTEREALEAGTVWWDGDLFTGRPDFRKLLAYPRPKLRADEQAFIDGPCEELCGMLDEWDITHNRADLPDHVWDFLKRKGFFSMIIEKKYGGLEFSAFGHSEVLIKIASRSPTCASIVAVPNSLGPAELLHRYGTEEQKDHYLPRLARGDEIPCFALTSPLAGSDAGAIPDVGIVGRGEWRGAQLVGIRLTFDKRYITLAPSATVIGLAFKLYDPEHLLGDMDREAYGITCALIPRDTPGLNIGRRHFPLNIPFQNGPLWGKDVFVPLDTIIGGPKMAGQGWRMLIECLSAGRSISLPSNTTGGAKLGVYTTGAYARIRKQFKTPIGRFEGVEDVIARMGGTLYAMEAARVMTVGAVDLGEVPSVPSAIVKYHVTEMARQVANDAMDVHGGKGICLGPRNYLGRGYQSVPIAITVEGANILTRSMIIFGQGAIRCHPFVLREMRAAALDDPDQALAQFDDALWGHIGFAISNAARAAWLAATHARYTHVPVEGPVRRYYQHIQRYSAAFALVADASMLTLGGKLKIKEKVSARLGDMLSYLYIASAVLKRWEDDGRPPEDLPLVHWACRTMLYNLQERLHSLLRNFPNQAVGATLRMLVFPLGRKYSAPSDATGRDIAELLIGDTRARDRLCAGIFTGVADGKDHVGLLAEALKLAVKAEPIEHRLRKAQKDGQLSRDERTDLRAQALERKLIDAEESRTLARLDELMREIVAVDHFEHAELRRVQ
jgi:acyl-CoA dehydrogenase